MSLPVSSHIWVSCLRSTCWRSLGDGKFRVCLREERWEKPDPFGTSQSEVQGEETIGVTWPRKDTREDKCCIWILKWFALGKNWPVSSSRVSTDLRWSWACSLVIFRRTLKRFQFCLWVDVRWKERAFRGLRSWRWRGQRTLGLVMCWEDSLCLCMTPGWVGGGWVGGRERRGRERQKEQSRSIKYKSQLKRWWDQTKIG